jgi:GDPmannose 4,6-dehydratase
MKTALISGITGQDGRYLARTLLERGFRVIGSTRGDPAAARRLVETWAGGHVETVRLDVADGPAVSKLISELQPDRVFHLAGQSSVGRSFAEPAETWQSAALSTLHVLEAVRNGSPTSRCLVAGSGEAFGDTLGERANEASPMRPRSPYAGAKAAASHLVTTYREAYGLFACTAIFYNHESPLRPRAFFTRKVIRAAVEIAARTRESISLGALDVARDFGWAEEYLDAAYRMLELETAEDFVLATGVSHPLRRFVELAFAHVGLDYRRHVSLDPGLLRKGEIAAMNADPSKASSLLDWRATVTLDELVARMIHAERSLDAGTESPA